MTKIHQAKVSMQAVHTLPDPGASHGARRATEGGPQPGRYAAHRAAHARQPATAEQPGQGESGDRGPKKTCSAAGLGYNRRQAREHMMASVQELVPTLGGVAACRVLGLWRGAPARYQASQRRAAFVGPRRARAARPRPPMALDSPGNPAP